MNENYSFDKVKNMYPERQGQYLGEENENFYVALTPEEVYELSPLAYYVWLLCDGKHSIKEIAEKMSHDLNMDLNEVIEPLIQAIKGLTSVKLVVLKR